MKVYIVLSENGTVLAVYKNQIRAKMVIKYLDTIYYEKATMKECKVL